ncbi:hypothetical protein OG21DRAFT_959566 [Imleria badia]|nr:hypothetical protein OG21DRAFT_959566 [Imleria badia]
MNHGGRFYGRRSTQWRIGMCVWWLGLLRNLRAVQRRGSGYNILFCLDCGSGKPIDIPLLEFEFSNAVLHPGRSPFIYMVSTLVFYTRTRVFYEFPRFLIALVCGS